MVEGRLRQRPRPRRDEAPRRVPDGEGKRVQPGEMVRFVVRNADGDRPHRRVCPVELAPPDRVDVGWYRDKVVHALSSLVLAMGWSKREVEAAVQGQAVGRFRTSEGGPP